MEASMQKAVYKLISSGSKRQQAQQASVRQHFSRNHRPLMCVAPHLVCQCQTSAGVVIQMSAGNAKVELVVMAQIITNRLLWFIMSMEVRTDNF